MKIGIGYALWSTDWKADYLHFLRKVTSLGFDGLEISASDLLTMSNQQLDELKAAAKDCGGFLTCNLGPAKENDIASRHPEIRKRGIETLTAMLHAMDRLDSRYLIGALYSYWPYDFEDLDKEGLWARGVESLQQVAKIAESLGIDLCLEVINRFDSNIVNTAEEGVRYCQDVGSSRVKLLIDTFHANIEEYSIPDAIRTAGSLLGYMHLGENNRTLPGMGCLPWQEIGKAIHSVGFDGPAVMEPFLKNEGRIGIDAKVWRDLSNGADEAKLDDYAKKSLRFVRNAFSVS